MGLTFVEGTVHGPTGKSRQVQFLVDSGATYSLLPHDVWQEIEIEPLKTLSFAMADGTPIDREIGECRIELAGESRHTPVILGIPGDEPLLGAVTLEILGLVLNPFQRKLQPMKLRLG